MAISLKQIIEELKKELREDSESDDMFVLRSAEITLKITATESATTKGGIQIWVLNAGVDSADSLQSAHEIRVQLEPYGADILLGSPKKKKDIG